MITFRDDMDIYSLGTKFTRNHVFLIENSGDLESGINLLYCTEPFS